MKKQDTVSAFDHKIDASYSKKLEGGLGPSWPQLLMLSTPLDTVYGVVLCSVILTHTSLDNAPNSWMAGISKACTMHIQP